MKQRVNRALQISVFGLVASASPAWTHGSEKHPASVPAPAAAAASTDPFPVAIGGPFRLRATDGRVVDSSRDLAGRIAIIFFGYARCQGLCPTALDAMAHSLDLLPAGSAHKVLPILITIDPEHDTPANLGAELTQDHPRILGLTGTADEIATVRKTFGVRTVQVHTMPDETPVYAHGSWIYVLRGDGALAALLPPTATPEKIAAAVRRWL